jgi:hypothetical protein
MQLGKVGWRYFRIATYLETLQQALERFAAEAPIPDDSPENEALYDKKVSVVPFKTYFREVITLYCIIV